MISKISKGHGFKGVIAYVSGKRGAEYIGGNVSENPKRAAHEMGALKKYSQCRTPVWHCSLSLSPEDRPLSNMEFRELAEKFLQKMGLKNNQYTVYRHTDREHAHIHIIVNRIGSNPNHTVWNSWQDIKRAREAKTELEHEFNLIETPYNPQFARPEISRGQMEEARRKGIIPSKQYVAEAIAIAVDTANVRNFVKSLNSQGVQVIPNISQTTGRMNGFSFLFGKWRYKGSQLRCSWKELSERLHYSAELDNEFLLSLLPEEKRPQEEIRERTPRRERTIYTMAEWLHMGGDTGSDYKRAYRMINSGYSLRDVAQEIKLHTPSMSEKQLQKTLLRAGQLWIDNNRNKLLWAHNSRSRRYIRFSNDPAVMLIQVLGLLVGAAVRAVLQGIEEHQAIRRIDSLSLELREMRDYAERKAMQHLHRLEQQERELEPGHRNLLIRHAQKIGLERSR